MATSRSIPSNLLILTGPELLGFLARLRRQRLDYLREREQQVEALNSRTARPIDRRDARKRLAELDKLISYREAEMPPIFDHLVDAYGRSYVMDMLQAA